MNAMHNTDYTETHGILNPHEPPPFWMENAGSDKPFILLCEHAANLVPKSLNSLGLTHEQLQTHYAYDIGVLDVTRRMAEILGCPALFGGYSRLVIDVNRPLDHPTLFAVNGEGNIIPGNQFLSQQECRDRIQEIYDPYDNAVSRWLNNKIDHDIVPAMISVHSFTPKFFNFKRPWEITTIYSQDDRMPKEFMKRCQEKGFTVGDNKPYDGRVFRGHVTNRHGDNRKVPNLLIEFRNDTINSPPKAHKMAETCADIIGDMVSDPKTFTYYDGPIVERRPEIENIMMDLLAEAARKGEDINEDMYLRD